MFLSALFISALIGCQPVEEVTGSPVEGTISVCLGGPDGTVIEQDAMILVNGTITAVDTGTADDMNLVTCGTDPTHSIEIEDGDGALWTVGVSVDIGGEDRTPTFAVTEGDVVDLDFRSRLVWGTVAGFSLSDDIGLIGAVDEGTWGGAFEGSVAGIDITRGDDPIASEETSCQPIEHFELTFSADTETTMSAGISGQVMLGDLECEALTVAAWDYGKSKTCSISDATGASAWVLSR